ncbi:hypothetical protein L9F63_018780, partial [Diploptera punctata]
EYAETAMNELLGWYGYDKLDSRDTQGLNLHHFATQRSPSDLDSSDAEGARSSSSPGRRDAGTGSSQGSPPLPGVWCWMAAGPFSPPVLPVVQKDQNRDETSEKGVGYPGLTETGYDPRLLVTSVCPEIERKYTSIYYYEPQVENRRNVTRKEKFSSYHCYS